MDGLQIMLNKVLVKRFQIQSFVFDPSKKNGLKCNQCWRIDRHSLVLFGTAIFGSVVRFPVRFTPTSGRNFGLTSGSNFDPSRALAVSVLEIIKSNQLYGLRIRNILRSNATRIYGLEIKMDTSTTNVASKI